MKSIWLGRVRTKTAGKLKQMNPTAFQMKNIHTKGMGAGGELQTSIELLFIFVVVWAKQNLKV